MLDIKLKLRRGHTSPRDWRSLSALKTLFWNMTYACNFRCPICFSDSGRPTAGELSLQESRQMIDNAARAGVQEFILSGGEPLSHPHLLELLSYMAQLGCSARIATNGSLITDQVLERMQSETRVKSFQVSLDTLEPLLYQKIHGCGPGVMEQVLEHMALMMARGFHTTVALRLTPETLPGLPALLDHASKEGWSTVTVHCPVPVRRSAGTFGPDEDILALLEPVIHHFCSIPHWLIETYIPWAPYHPSIQALEKEVRFVHRGCSAGRDRLTVTPEGHIVPCVCLDLPQAYLGNVRQHDLGEVFAHAPLCHILRHPERHGICEGCVHLSRCGGGCRTVAIASTGRLDGQDTSCPLWRSGLPR